MGRDRCLQAVGRPATSRVRVHLLRRSTVRHRDDALRARPPSGDQGRGPPVLDDAGLPGRTPLRLGHPWAPCGDGGGEPAGHLRSGGDRRVRHRSIQRRLPRPGRARRRRVGGHHHPGGAVDRLRGRLPDHGPRVHGDGLVGVPHPVGQGPGLPLVQGAAVLVGGGDPAVQLRGEPRRLPRRRRPFDHRPARGGRGRRPGGTGRPAAGVDDDSVDASRQPRGRCRARHRLRRRGGRRPPRLGGGRPGRGRLRRTGRRPGERHR